MVRMQRIQYAFECGYNQLSREWEKIAARWWDDIDYSVETSVWKKEV